MAYTPPGKRPQNLDRRFDQTQLKSTLHGKLVHRDYAAHFFRWGFATTYVAQGKTRVLDIGCGQEWPLARQLNQKLGTLPDIYVGVDLNKIQKKPGIRWTNVEDEFNFIDDHEKLAAKYGRRFDLVTCFEVIEHMHRPDGLKLLKAVRKLVAPNATFLLSTPVYNERKMAANHIKEYTVKELQELIDESGDWTVERRFGTFASWNDLKKVMTPQERALYEELHGYYDHEVLSCFLAPKYPDASRNNVWLLRPTKGAASSQKKVVRKKA